MYYEHCHILELILVCTIINIFTFKSVVKLLFTVGLGFLINNSQSKFFPSLPTNSNISLLPAVKLTGNSHYSTHFKM